MNMEKFPNKVENLNTENPEVDLENFGNEEEDELKEKLERFGKKALTLVLILGLTTAAALGISRKAEAAEKGVEKTQQTTEKAESGRIGFAILFPDNSSFRLEGPIDTPEQIDEQIEIIRRASPEELKHKIMLGLGGSASEYSPATAFNQEKNIKAKAQRVIDKLIEEKESLIKINLPKSE